jgi:hypothetical protein
VVQVCSFLLVTSKPCGAVHALNTHASVLVPPDAVFGRSDLAALRGCHTLNVCLSG